MCSAAGLLAVGVNSFESQNRPISLSFTLRSHNCTRQLPNEGKTLLLTKLRELSSLNRLGAEKRASNDDGYCWAESCGHGNKRERLYWHTGSRVSELIGLEWQGNVSSYSLL